MSQRIVVTLLAALVALVLLATVGRQGGSASSGAGEMLVPALAAALNDVERVTIVKANGETVAALEKRPDNWVVTNKHDYNANISKLRQGLLALSEARVLEQKTANADLHGRLGVEDVTGATAAGLRVAITAAGSDLATVILGNAEGSRYRYARRDPEAQSYLIDRNPDVPRSAAQWLDAEIIDVRSERVKQVTITHADGEVVSISKASPELADFDVGSVPGGRELLYAGVANVVGNALRELNLEDVEPAAAAAAEQATVVEYRTFDGLIVRITGTKDAAASWVSLAASVDAELAAAPAAAAPAAADGAAPTAVQPDPAAEAARINAKVGAWRYQIAGFQYDQMTRRMADLLKPRPAA